MCMQLHLYGNCFATRIVQEKDVFYQTQLVGLYNSLVFCSRTHPIARFVRWSITGVLQVTNLLPSSMNVFPVDSYLACSTTYGSFQYWWENIHWVSHVHKGVSVYPVKPYAHHTPWLVWWNDLEIQEDNWHKKTSWHITTRYLSVEVLWKTKSKQSIALVAFKTRISLHQWIVFTSHTPLVSRWCHPEWWQCQQDG